ncbi:heterokaryon incompatibility protein-domain-containing protein [Aspergillus flavus]|uniref:Heterokaryon incompatibility protein-domain-containing protein n=1 Tax=Aspergillus flavus (strain ATCC 200026 / FGSC A1120 / IAM 13836 / NRRL 3357 / JCM 12722 / SRRC 167) TaxID=332952 RepID=A0A7U2MD77_ASPFN|nr:heterokaryon incompatibility protein-domain-containing protein [Aspergillus flavus]
MEPGPSQSQKGKGPWQPDQGPSKSQMLEETFDASEQPEQGPPQPQTPGGFWQPDQEPSQSRMPKETLFSHEKLEQEPPQPEVSTRALDIIHQMSTWLRAERWSMSLTERNQSMPPALRATQNIDRLCTGCAAFDWKTIWKQMHRGKLNWPTKQHRPLSTMYNHLRSAYEGCHLCTLICVAMFSRGERRVHIPRWQEYHLSVDETSAEWQSRTQPAPRRWSLEQLDAATRVSHHMESGKGVLLIEVQGCEPAKLLVSFAQRTEEPLLPTVRSDGRTSGFARHWMQICDESHLSCKRTGSILPTRVIQLQIIHEELKARLLVTNGEEARYAALSHRWSCSTSLTVTTHNLERLKKGIDFAELSHTFREALEIAAGIGLQYIWIDALCILQDDDHDWARESAKMGDVYRHAAITINAFASADGMGQCTTAYPPTNLVDYACRIGGEVYVHEEDGGFADVYEPEGVTQTRGWVFQEEQLSPRRLYCGQHHLVWKCAEMWARNDRPCGFSGEVFDKPFMSTYPCSNWKFAYRQWRRMVQSYTRHNLTYAAKDKLPAISGLAAVFDQEFPGHHVGDYLGGIWRGDIYRGLLWYRDGNAIDRDRRIEGPSWSWASWDGPINFVFEDDDASWPARMTWQPQRKYPCKVREASTILTDPENKYGRVSSGRMVVKGKVLMNAGRLGEQSENTRPTDPEIHLDHDETFPEDSVLLPITQRSGLLLRMDPRTANDAMRVFRRIGLCIRPERHEDFNWMRGARWETQELALE